ncbi:GtrA family protein [Desulfatitalea tepidiphila]|uniref:GtrA family protein n=1 Tax=Desulfatitalea tepidiphila TaxID=1185843 RepID=UPI0006B46FFC|nr:GtrA family protein [Desulfatitalea tepidiphila]
MKTSARIAVQLFKYLGASIAGTLVHYSLLIILIRSLSLKPLWASTSGAIAGAMVIYVLNYFVTFQSTRGHISASSRFFFIAAICTAVNGWVLNFAMTQMNLPLAPAQVFATGAQFSVGFAVHRGWTF